MATLTVWAPERRDIIWVDFNPQAGAEMRDEHPLLVLSTKVFNRRTGIVIGLPMTHSSKNEGNPFAVRYEHKGEVGYVLTHQPKSFDWQARRARPHPWVVFPEELFAEACDGLNAIIQV